MVTGSPSPSVVADWTTSVVVPFATVVLVRVLVGVVKERHLHAAEID